jgi:rRNA maturation endonuclease Nob1
MPYLRCVTCGALVRTTADACPVCSLPLRIPRQSSALVRAPGGGLRCADCGELWQGPRHNPAANGEHRCSSCGANLTGAGTPAETGLGEPA